jgi:hypothetical protein
MGDGVGEIVGDPYAPFNEKSWVGNGAAVRDPDRCSPCVGSSVDVAFPVVPTWMMRDGSTPHASAAVRNARWSGLA